MCVCVCLQAYLKWVETEGEEPRLPGLEMDHRQLFFLNFAQVSKNNEGTYYFLNIISAERAENFSIWRAKAWEMHFFSGCLVLRSKHWDIGNRSGGKTLKQYQSKSVFSYTHRGREELLK